MERIAIKTPARLHFGLIDMNGGLGRVDGGVGLALESPYTLIEAKRADTIQVQCESDPGMAGRFESAVSRVCGHYDLPGAHVRVNERYQPHVGLGSSTQMLVGAAQAVCGLYGLDRPARELARLVGRGGTSGIGIAAIESGGFILDGGHRFRRGPDSKQGHSPSSASEGIEPPPILARYPFPDWDILVAIPLGEGASGAIEARLFDQVCPIPRDEVETMCHIVLMQMLPAVLESDLATFGKAMDSFQKLGFKAFELRAQTQSVLDCLEFLRDHGGIGVGMSSWGPAVFAFGEDLSELHGQTQRWLEAHGGGEAILTKANNVGLRPVRDDE